MCIFDGIGRLYSWAEVVAVTDAPPSPSMLLPPDGAADL
eukprot:gene4462-67159_t